MKHAFYGSEIKQTLKVASPLIAANLVQASSSFISTLMLAKLGTDSLAASGLVSPLYFALIVIFWGMLSGISVLVAQAHGANQPNRIRAIMHQGILFTSLISIPMMLILWVIPRLLKYNMVEPVIVELASQYLQAMIWIVIPGSCLVLVEQLLIGIQKASAVMFLSLLSVPLEIAASYIFIFGKFGLPAFGVAGVGYGFALAYALVSILAIIYISWHKDIKPYRIFIQLPRLELRFLHEIFRIGWPIGAMYGIEVSLFAALALFMGKVGAIALDAHQIVMQFMGPEITVSFALMQATSIRVGHAIGSKNFSSLPAIGQAGMLLATLVALAIGIIYCLFPRWIVGLDISPEQAGGADILALTTKLLMIIAVFQVAEAVRIVAMGGLRGMKDTRFPMFNSLISFWLIGFSLSYLLGVVLQCDAVGLWLGITIGAICGALILALRYRRLAKRYMLIAT